MISSFRALSQSLLGPHCLFFLQAISVTTRCVQDAADTYTPSPATTPSLSPENSIQQEVHPGKDEDLVVEVRLSYGQSMVV